MSQTNSARMPDIFDLLALWWKQILAIVITAVVIVGIVLFLKEPKYLATSTALPGATYASDKAAVFSENIMQLYPNLGTPDDLDLILGTAQLDTIYYAVTEKFNLWDHYGISNQDGESRQKTVSKLKADTKVIKSDYGELKVKVWSRDRNLAAGIANALMQELQLIHQRIQNASNISILNSLKEGQQKLLAGADSVSNFLRNADITGTNATSYTIRRDAMLGQVSEYEKLIAQYDLMVNTTPPALIVVEAARPPVWTDGPKRGMLLAATALLAFIFALLVALVWERRKFTRQ